MSPRRRSKPAHEVRVGLYVNCPLALRDAINARAEAEGIPRNDLILDALRGTRATKRLEGAWGERWFFCEGLTTGVITVMHLQEPMFIARLAIAGTILDAVDAGAVFYSSRGEVLSGFRWISEPPNNRATMAMVEDAVKDLWSVLATKGRRVAKALG